MTAVVSFWLSVGRVSNDALKVEHLPERTVLVGR